MRKDQCLFCTSRNCFTRIVSVDDMKIYDEIACRRHTNELHKHSDEKAPKIVKLYMSSTGCFKRGESIKKELSELKSLSE